MSAIFFVVFVLAADMEQLREVEVAFISTAALLVSLLYLIYRRPIGRGERPLRPGSTEELEATLRRQTKRPEQPVDQRFPAPT